MRNNTLFYLSVLFLFAVACTQGPDYKVVRDQVVSIHDSVMMNTEKAYAKKRSLDTLSMKMDSLKKAYPSIDTAKERTSINSLRTRLEDADNKMNDWMHKFDAEAGNKSNEEAVQYFTKEKEKIKSIDSLYINLLKESDSYLMNLKKK